MATKRSTNPDEKSEIRQWFAANKERRTEVTDVVKKISELYLDNEGWGYINKKDVNKVVFGSSQAAWGSAFIKFNKKSTVMQFWLKSKVDFPQFEFGERLTLKSAKGEDLFAIRFQLDSIKDIDQVVQFVKTANPQGWKPNSEKLNAEATSAEEPKVIKDQFYGYPEEVEDPEKFVEGATKKIAINLYERSPQARLKCISALGTKCVVCKFDFESEFGEIGRGYIHVHHLKQLADIGVEYEIDPVADLRPVCPNCHAMLHRRRPAYSIEELIELRKSG